MAKKTKVTTIPKEDFFKSLGKLEAYAHEAGEQGGENLSKAQLFHTSGNSEPAGWPGGETTKYENWDDSIGKDGTDYKAARKAIAEKAMKGLPLSPAEISILKSDIESSMAKGEGQEVEDGGGKGAKGEEGQEACKAVEDEEEEGKPASEEKDKAYKSLNGIVPEYQAVQTGVEVSPFLSELVKALSARLDMIEKSVTDQTVDVANSILKNIGEYIDSRFAEVNEFNKSMADAIVNIGHGVAGNLEQTIVHQEMPVGPPKSQLHMVEKSFAGPKGDNISKSQILDAMTDMVEKGQLSSVEVCKYETTNDIRPDLRDQIVQRLRSVGTN